MPWLPVRNCIIRGVPAPFANGEPEQQWREAISHQCGSRVDLGGERHLRFKVWIQFLLAPGRCFNGNDIDNLAKPVVDTLVNENNGALFLVDDTYLSDLTVTKTVALPGSEGEIIEGAIINVWLWIENLPPIGDCIEGNP